MNDKIKKRQASLDAFFTSKVPPWTAEQRDEFTRILVAEKKRAETAIIEHSPFSGMFRK